MTSEQKERVEVIQRKEEEKEKRREASSQGAEGRGHLSQSSLGLLWNIPSSSSHIIRDGAGIGANFPTM